MQQRELQSFSHTLLRPQHLGRSNQSKDPLDLRAKASNRPDGHGLVPCCRVDGGVVEPRCQRVDAAHGCRENNGKALKIERFFHDVLIREAYMWHPCGEREVIRDCSFQGR